MSRQWIAIGLAGLMLLIAAQACTLSNEAQPTPQPVVLNPGQASPTPFATAQASATPAATQTPTPTPQPTSTPLQTAGGGTGAQPVSVVPTSVQYIMAQQTVRIRTGPGTGFGVIGQVMAGQIAAVTGISSNGQWWRVICPDGSVGNCWVTADPLLTQPAYAPGQPGNPGGSIPVVPAPVAAVRVLTDVRIRNGPGTQYVALALLSGGQVVRVTGMSVDGQWYRIECTHDPAGNCWITAAGSVTQPANPYEPPPYAGPVLNTPIRTIIALQDVTVRTGPGIEYGGVSVLPAGQIGYVNGISPDRLWYRVDCAPNMAGACWVPAQPGVTEPRDIDSPPPDSGPVVDTPVRYAKALADIYIRSGPGTQYQAVGLVAAGQLARVNGITPDQLWYRIDCAPNVTGNCWITAAPSVAEPFDPSTPTGSTPMVVATTMNYVQAKADVTIYVGLGPGGNAAGTVFAGQTARVLGITIDYAWWQVPCPGDGPTQCFVSADPALTEPKTGPGI